MENITDKYIARSVGMPGGFKVALRLHRHEYAPWTETAAMTAFIHPMTEEIFSESPRYNAEPGGESSMLVTETRYSHLGSPYGRSVESTDEVAAYY